MPTPRPSSPGLRVLGGYSLVELLIGVLIGLFLTAGVMGLFVSNKRVYVQATKLSQLQENSRFALQYLVADLRQGGFLGESPWFNTEVDEDSIDAGNVGNNCGGDASIFDYETPIWGTTATSARAITCIPDALVVSGIPSDVLVIRSAETSAIRDTNNDGTVGDGNEDANGDGTTDADDALQPYTVYVVSNTQQGLLMMTGDANSISGVPTVHTGGAYPYGGYRGYRFHAYYIRDDDSQDDDPPTLSRMTLSQGTSAGVSVVSEDLVEGVEAMRILYGVDSDADGSVDQLTNAAGVSDWTSVVTVRIFLLVRSTDPDFSYRDARSYRLGDVTVTATQAATASQGAQLRNFRRVVVSTTLTLRNMQIAVQAIR